MPYSIDRRFLTLLASSMSFALYIGLPLAGGVLYAEWCDYFTDTPRQTIAWIISLNTGLIFGVGPVASILAAKVGYVRCYVLGVLISSSATFCSAFLSSPIHLIISYGIFAGIGNALSSVPASVVVNLIFKKHRLPANAFAVSGVGLGTFGGSMILRHFIERYGWVGCMMLYSSVTLQGLVLATFVTLPRNQVTVSRGRWTLRENPVLQVLKSGYFLIFFLSDFSWNIGNIIFFSMLPEMAKEMGHSPRAAVYLLTIVGLSNFIGRILCIGLGFQRRVASFTLHIISTALTGLPILLCPLFAMKYASLASLCVIFGLSFSVQLSTLSPAIIEVLPPDLFLFSYGWVILADGIGLICGAPLAGFIYDNLRVYSPAFYIGGCGFLLAAMLLSSSKIHYQCTAHENEDEAARIEDNWIEEKNFIAQ